MDPEFVKARRIIQEKVFQFLVQKLRQPNEIPKQRIIHVAKRLDVRIFRTTTSQEEYLNLDTLETRLLPFFERRQSTPGMPQHGNTNSVSSSVDSCSISTGDRQPRDKLVEVMKIIEEMIVEGLLVEGSPLWCFTISALMSEKNRLMFLAIPGTKQGLPG